MSGRPFFVVGCPRSGTTLLRSMLDCHPRLAVPPRESHWIIGLAPRRLDWGRPRPWHYRPVRSRLERGGPATVERLLALEILGPWGLDPDAVRRAVATARPAGYAGEVHAIFDAYASAQGKARWGDKTPPHVSRLPMLARLFPDAQFLHILRDGRDVATSLAEQEWGPPDALIGAFWWRRYVSAGRRAGRRLGPDRDLGLRLEDLIAAPEARLGDVCGFLGETYSAQMLDYPDRVRSLAGNPTHRHLERRPTSGLRDWRRGLSVAEAETIEAACAPLLRELGYSVPHPPIRRRARARTEHLRHRASHAMGQARVRIGRGERQG